MLPTSFLNAAVTKYTSIFRNDEYKIDVVKIKHPSKPEALKATKHWMELFEKVKNYVGQMEEQQELLCHTS